MTDKKEKEQLEATFTENNELILIESKTMRDQHVYREVRSIVDLSI